MRRGYLVVALPVYNPRLPGAVHDDDRPDARVSAKHVIPPARWPSRAEAAASLLFSPLRVGTCALRTRTWVPAMVPWRSTDEGFVTDAVLDWYGRFADGRPGALVIEATGIRDVPSGPLLRIGHDRFLDGLRELAAVVKQRSHGETRLFVQIIDFLGIKRRPEKAIFVRRFLALRDEHRSALAQVPGYVERARGDEVEVREALLELPHETLLALLSPREARDLEFGWREEVNDLERPHVAELPRVLPGLFADAAERAQRAGFDGVELHYAHAYTMASFLSRRNERTDGYGGSREARVRLPLEVLRAVRARVGADFTVGCRLLGDEAIEGGSTIADACFYALELARAGLDFVSLSKGGKFEDAKQPRVGEAAYPYTGPSGHECMPTVRIPGAPPFGRNLHLARAVRSTLRAAGLDTPVVGVGGINDFELAERALSDGDCDLVGAARQSLADPDWWRKLELGLGAEIRRCVFTNYCEGLDQRHKQVTCQLWDRDFEQPDVGSDAIARSHDGKRRLVAPPWASADLPEDLELRCETAADIAAIENVTRSAFLHAPHSSRTEHFIVSALRRAGALTVSLVADAGGVVIGHVAVSPVAISDGARDWYGLGPVSVAPEQQGRGVGSRLVRAALLRLSELGAAGCVVLGEPSYYERFGFHIEPALSFPGAPPEHFQAVAFAPSMPRGVVTYHAAFDARS